MRVDILESIRNALIELRNSSIQCHNDENSYKKLINRYDMVFTGENFGIIYSIELCHSLNTKFGIQVDLKDLNLELPALCKSLHMTCEPMRDVSDLSNPIPAAYKIILH